MTAAKNFAIVVSRDLMQGENADLRVLHRVDPIECIPCAPQPRAPFTTVAVVDTETTGLEPEIDEVIEIAVALLKIDAFGRVVEVIDTAQSLRNPGFQIPQKIENLTGISDAMVADVAFDTVRFVALLQQADVIVAHNAEFDSKFVERLLPEVARQPWACSLRQVDWREAGFDGATLGYLLMQTGRFNNGHRAMDDVASLIHVLTHEPANAGTILASLIRTASEPGVGVEATGAAFEKRTILKGEGYRWDSAKKVWWKESSWLLAPVEEAWLREEIIPQRCVPYSYPLTWRERFR